MASHEIVCGFISAALAALCFGSYGVPMKGEAATRVDVDPLVFQSYKAVAVLFTSTICILVNNIIAGNELDNTSTDLNHFFHKWSLSEFTPWAFISALLWVPGGTAGVYAIRHAGLAISVGIWSCVIVIVSYGWGVWIFDEEQKSFWGAIRSVAMLCIGLCGCAYFSSREIDGEAKNNDKGQQMQLQSMKNDNSISNEYTPLVKSRKHVQNEIHLGELVQTNSEVVQTTACIGHMFQLSEYHTGICMAIVNGILAATMMVPLHYAPATTTAGLGYSMSFGIAALLVLLLYWLLRIFWLACYNNYLFGQPNIQKTFLGVICRINVHSLRMGYKQLPSFHLQTMWKAGMTSGIVYSVGNLFGILSIQKLGNFMGYCLNQSSVIISGMWGILYYKEITGATNMIGFSVSTVLVFWGILLLGSERMGRQ